MTFNRQFFQCEPYARYAWTLQALIALFYEAWLSEHCQEYVLSDCNPSMTLFVVGTH
jgi:hypothetical protein